MLKTIIALQLFTVFIVICILIYLLIRRIQKKEKETFEKRDN